jgi:hypothetical protein
MEDASRSVAVPRSRWQGLERWNGPPVARIAFRLPQASVVHSASPDGGCGGPAAARQTVMALCLLCPRRNTRGAHSLDCSMSCAKRHAVMLSRTLRQVSDLSMLFCRPTAAHLAPFILPSLGRCSAPRRSCAALRQIAIRQNSDQAPRQRSRGRVVAVDVVRPRWPQVRRVSPGRPRRGAGAAAAVSVLCRSSAGGRQADGSRSDVVMSAVVDSGRQIGHGNIDVSGPTAEVASANQGSCNTCTTVGRRGRLGSAN